MPAKEYKEVTIRMYKQGLGDCFLLSFPRKDKDKAFNLLIDCGALRSKHYGAELMKKVVENVRVTTGGRLDAVAATHEHWDHISGFSQAEKEFAKIKVDQVWAAWTEEPGNDAARVLKERFKKSKKAVEKAVEKIPDEEKGNHLGAYKKAITELFGFFGGLGAAGAGTTEKAWDNFLGLSHQKAYLFPKKAPIEVDGVEDVRIYVLGPPEDPEYVRKKLSKAETYDEGKHAFAGFASFAAAFESDDNEGRDLKERAFPFDRRYRVLPETARDNPFFIERYGFADAQAEPWRRIDHDWLRQAGELALHLDSYTNNTCLALAIELGQNGKVLIFPGDAQVGNWLSWNDLKWKVRDRDGTTRTVTIDDLLERTVLYKVGHHGSHNATMRAKGLEKMISDQLVAMIPVHRPTADDQEWEFPYGPLWKRLREKCCGRVLLADAAGFNEISEDLEKSLSTAQINRFKTKTRFEDLFVEYKIDY